MILKIRGLTMSSERNERIEGRGHLVKFTSWPGLTRPSPRQRKQPTKRIGAAVNTWMPGSSPGMTVCLCGDAL